MARRNRVRESVLAEVKKRQRAAGQKVSRLERQGIRVKNAGLDPRQAMSNVNSMGTRELRSYLRSLNGFIDRGNGFVPGFQGRPISSREWARYRKLERENNRRALEYLNSVANLPMPGGDSRTLGQRLADVTPQDAARAGIDQRAYEVLGRQSKNIVAGKLEKLIEKLENKLSPGYLERESKIRRDIIEQMLTTAGDHDMVEKLRELNDEQLNVLVDYTDFMKAAEARYEYAKTADTDKPSFRSQEFDTYGQRVGELIDWAGKIPTSRLQELSSGVKRGIGGSVFGRKGRK